MDVFQTLVEREIRDIETQRHMGDFTNLTIQEQIALNTLKNNRHIIVRSAEKWGSVVVLDKGLYEKLISLMLSDNNVYKHLSHNPTRNITHTQKCLLWEGVELGIINDKQCDYMLDMPNFFRPPKNTQK